MIIYPAIDLKDGQCVRLVKGDMAKETIYNDNPAAQALTWAKAGFGWIHIVDLNGAIDGRPVNQNAVHDILKSVDVPIQLGGGIRSLEQIEHWLSEGISRVILGTIALRKPEIVREACRLFPNQIAVGIDARKGMVAVEGWVEDSDMQATDLAKHFEDEGVCAIIYTDIERDGTGEGVNIEATANLAASTSIPIIASGGIGSLKDVQDVQAAAQTLETGSINGIIIGKALYDQHINPRDLLSPDTMPDTINEGE